MSELPTRQAPLLTDTNRHFWTGGEAGELRFTRCGDCSLYLHPPAWTCRRCRSTNVAVETVSGRGTVVSFTVNHHSWVPGLDDPFTIAVVELAEQEGLRLISNIVGCTVDDVEIGMDVEVAFEPADDLFVPVFTPSRPR